MTTTSTFTVGHATPIFGAAWAATIIAFAAPSQAAMAQRGMAGGGDWSPRQLAEEITAVGSILAGDPVAWMPDGVRILVPAALGGGTFWTVTVDGGAMSRLTSDLAAQSPRLAPDGSHIAYVSDKSGNPELWVWDVREGRDRQLTRFGARINALAWAPDARAIAFAAMRHGSFDVWVVTLADGAVRRLTSSERHELSPAWTPDGRTLLFVRADERWVDHDIVAIPASGGEERLVARDTGFFDYGTIGMRSTFGAPLVSPDGSRILFRSTRSGWINWWIAPIGGGEARPLAQEAADQSDAAWSPDGRSVAFVSNRNGALDLRVAPSSGGAPRVVVPVTSGMIGSPAWSPDGRRIAYTFQGLTTPNDLYVVNADGGAPRRLTSSIPATTERLLVTPEKVRYRSDDFDIAAYLYKPPRARPGERFPAILYIHGGPTGQFADNFQYQPQFLARMGYVVLAPNIRGSSGYGKAFEKANDPCWTICDLRDVVAGAEWLKRLDDVDGSRLGITGISYGGIMSMAAVGRVPDLFQAAIPQSGYADWVSFHEYNAELGHTKLLAHEWGPWPDSAAVYRRNSSIAEVPRIKAPVFLVQGVGRSDAWRPGVVPLRASQEFALALEREHKVVKYKTYPNETYYVNGRENRRQLLLDMLDWFDTYLKDGNGGRP